MALVDLHNTGQQPDPIDDPDAALVHAFLTTTLDDVQVHYESVFLERRAHDARHRTTAPRAPETLTEAPTAKPAKPTKTKKRKPTTTRRRPSPERQRDLEETAARLTPPTKRRYRKRTSQ